MPTLAGWLTGEEVDQEIIARTLTAMGEVLSQHGGEAAQMIQPGFGLLAFSDTAYAQHHNEEPPALDWVPDRRTLVYRRPLSGVHALYYCVDWPAPGNLLFASEIKALLALGVPRRLHLAALAALLRYGTIPAPWTIFKDIQLVPAGSLLRWQRGQTVVNHATDYHLEEPLEQAPTLDQVHTLLREVSEGQLPPHDQLVALTGGGSASTLATLLAARPGSTPFPLVTMGKTGTHAQWDGVQRLAEACEHPLLAITGADRPDFWTGTIAALEAPAIDTQPLALHQLLHTVAAETGARVALSGIGAHTLLNLAHYPLSAIEQANATEIFAAYRPAQRSRIWSPDAASALQAASPWEETLHARKLARKATQFTDPQHRRHYLDLHLRLPDYLVHNMQQLASQERMVLRSPYLSPRMIETLTRLPVQLEDGTPGVAVLERLLQRALPETFTPIPKLPLPAIPLRRDADFVRETLSPHALKTTGLFDVAAVERLLKQKTGQTLQRELLLVFTTQLLCQIFQVEDYV